MHKCVYARLWRMRGVCARQRFLLLNCFHGCVAHIGTASDQGLFAEFHDVLTVDLFCDNIFEVNLINLQLHAYIEQRSVPQSFRPGCVLYIFDVRRR